MRNYRFVYRPKCAQRWQRRRGQTLVEFAMIAMIFFTLLLGMIQFGIYQSTTNTLWNLSREGARFASVNAIKTDDEIKARVRQAAPPNVNTSDKVMTISVFPTDVKKRVSGQPVAVCITYDMKEKVFFPLVGFLFNRASRTIPKNDDPIDQNITVEGYNYFAASTMRIE
jgi:Flp pilus assembly protein TadG